LRALPRRGRRRVPAPRGLKFLDTPRRQRYTCWDEAGIRSGAVTDSPAEQAGRARRRREPIAQREAPAALMFGVASVSEELTSAEVARRAGVTPQTLRRWQRAGLIPQSANGGWTKEAAAQARLVARLRERGHSLEEIRRATESGRLAFGYIEDLFPEPDEAITVEAAARETGLEPALIERILVTMGFPARGPNRLTVDDLQYLRYAAAVLSAGFPLVAFLQLVRVYGQALAQISEEQGDEEAVSAVERFIEAVETTLPEDARIIKTIGDEVMVVGNDVGSLTDWAVGFQGLYGQRPQPRIGVHYGETVYRDGDYYGREVNLAARVAARAAGGEVLVTRSVVEQSGPHLEFDLIGEVRLKGFSEPTELFLARLPGAGPAR